VLSSVKANGKIQPVTGEFQAPFGENRLEFTCASPSYRHESRTQFEYRLLGLTEQWTRTWDRKIVYDRLPSGRYIFEVRARIPGAPVSREPARVPFSVLQAWWQTWWSLAGAAAAAGFGARGLWRWRVGLLLTRKRELEAAVEGRTRELEQEKCMLEAARATLHELASRDSLTGLLNRRAIFAFFERELARASRESLPLAIVMLDVDKFKSINDTCGHAAGDAVLQIIAQTLAQSVRSYDGVGRLGGEEFLLVLPGCSAGEARERAESILMTMNHLNIQVPGRREPIRVTCSGGLAWHSSELDTAAALLSAADAALYHAKHQGRNRLESATELPGGALAVQ
jgi:diguanylate cyclase (GGDEF)-like protein